MRTILAAVDQSHHAHDVMSRAAELAVLLRNDLVVLSVISSDPMKQFNIVEEQNRFASLHRELIFKHFPENSLAVEPHSGTGGVYKYGSERVVHKCTRSVLVVKGERLEGQDWQGLSSGQKSGASRV